MTTYSVPTIISEKRNEVWHQSDAGDIVMSFFDITLNERQLRTPMSEWSNIMLEDFAARVKKGFVEGVKTWAGMLGDEGEYPVTRPFMFPNACFVPEAGNEDKRRFYMACRVKRDHAKILPIDSVAELAGAGEVNQDAMLRNFVRQMGQFSEKNVRTDAETVGKTAYENSQLLKKIDEERALEKELEYRLNHKPF